jgi:transcriptional regulator with XRE-family HTH domain
MPHSQLQLARKQQALFSKRLIWALEVLGITPSPTILQREYNSISNQPAITIHAARKWLMGEAIPTQGRIQILAEWLNVSPSWLRFGEQESENKTTDMTAQEWRLVKGFRRLTEKQRVGVLAMVLAIPAPRPKKSK